MSSSSSTWRKTGTLRIRSELRQNRGTIWFERGAVVAAAIDSNPHPLGGILLRTGKLREEDLARAVKLQEQGDPRRIGEILVSLKAIPPRVLEEQVRTQVEDVVFTLLGWSEGHFIFEEGDPGDIPRDAEVRITTESVLLEAARRIDEWSQIESQVPHLGVVAQLAGLTGEDRTRWAWRDCGRTNRSCTGDTCSRNWRRTARASRPRSRVSRSSRRCRRRSDEASRNTRY